MSQDPGSSGQGPERKSRETRVKNGKKKLNSVLFVLVATLVNLLVMIAVFLLLSMLYGSFLAPQFSQAAGQVAVILIFFISVVTSYFFYHFFVKWLSKRIDMDRYFDPIFRIGGKK